MFDMHRKRARTVIEQAESHLLKYLLLPPCSGSCRKKCADSWLKSSDNTLTACTSHRALGKDEAGLVVTLIFWT